MVPIFSSVISTFHVIKLLNLGNPNWIAIFLAITYEMANLASLIGLSVLNKINRNLVWAIFIIVTLIQILGNSYFVYDYVSLSILSDENYLRNFSEFLFLTEFEPQTIKQAISYLIGSPVPILSLIFFKSMVNYLDSEEKKEEEEIQEEVVKLPDIPEGHVVIINEEETKIKDLEANPAFPNAILSLVPRPEPVLQEETPIEEVPEIIRQEIIEEASLGDSKKHENSINKRNTGISIT